MTAHDQPLKTSVQLLLPVITVDSAVIPRSGAQESIPAPLRYDCKGIHCLPSDFETVSSQSVMTTGVPIQKIKKDAQPTGTVPRASGTP